MLALDRASPEEDLVSPAKDHARLREDHALLERGHAALARVTALLRPTCALVVGDGAIHDRPTSTDAAQVATARLHDHERGT